MSFLQDPGAALTLDRIGRGSTSSYATSRGLAPRRSANHLEACWGQGSEQAARAKASPIPPFFGKVPVSAQLAQRSLAVSRLKEKEG
jgi:hypothetical protein